MSAPRKRLAHHVLFVVLLAVISVSIEECVGRIALHGAMAEASPRTVELYQALLHGGRYATTDGSLLTYQPHPYMGFALNPAAPYMGSKQFNSEYLIRRKQPIAPRSQATLRVLALGGSTTFGAEVAQEEDTWVWQVEKLLRDRFGPRTEVINGGIGGYNTIENLIHYQLLLSRLEPDLVVILIGVNDVHPRLVGSIKPDYTNLRTNWNPNAVLRPEVNRWLAWSALYRLSLWRRVESAKTGHIYSVIQRAYPPVEFWPSQLAKNGPEVFEAHLRTLLRLLRAEGRHVVVIPQLWIAKPHYQIDEAFGLGVEQNNAVLVRTAAELGVPCFTGGASKETFHAGELVDATHFNEAGSRHFAAVLAPWLIDNWSRIMGPAKVKDQGAE